MRLEVTDDSKVADAIKEGRVDERNMTETLDLCIQALVGRSNMLVQPNAELIDLYLAVEKTVSPIPWIDTSKCVFLEINKKILTSQKTIGRERLKMAKIHFPSQEINDVLLSCRNQYDIHVEMAKKKGQVYVQKEDFLLSWIKPELDNGCLVTEIDGQYNHIYSIATDIPTNMSQRYRESHFKSVVALLLNALPVSILTPRLEFAYLIVKERLCIFFRLQ